MVDSKVDQNRVQTVFFLDFGSEERKKCNEKFRDNNCDIASKWNNEKSKWNDSYDSKCNQNWQQNS